MNEFLHLLLGWDRTAFQFINSSLSNPVFDALLPWCRERWIWAPVYVFVVAFSLVNFGNKGWIIVFGLVVAVGLTDFTSNHLFKKNVKRLRPCNDPVMVDNVHLRIDCGSGYSFTSSHAANHFAVAVFLIGVFGGLARWVKPVGLVWAAMIAFSQVYVGVHFPVDVICGAVLGSMIAGLVLVVWRRVFKFSVREE